MPTGTVEMECPFCHTRLTPEVAPSYRPFSCPACHLLMDPRTYYARYAKPGCLTVCAILLGSLVLGLPWYECLLGAAMGGLVIASGLKLASLPRSRPPRLVPYSLQTYPENLPPLAEFLDEIATAAAWSKEYEKRLGTAKRQKTFDDELENVAIELAERYRDMLQGYSPRRHHRVKRSFRLEELRAELRAVAADVRHATGK